MTSQNPYLSSTEFNHISWLLDSIENMQGESPQRQPQDSSERINPR